MWFSKAGTDRIVYGPASTTILDKQGDIVTAPALRKSLASLLLNKAISLNHTDLIPGVILESYKADDGRLLKTEVRPVSKQDLQEFPRLGENGVKEGDEAMFVVAKIHNDPVLASYADDVWADVLNGTLNSFSISGKATGVSFKQDCNGFVCKLAKHIEDMAVSAVALCRRGANPSAGFITKSVDNYVIHSPRWDLKTDIHQALAQMDHRVMTGCDPTGHIAKTAAHLRKYLDEHTLHDPTAPKPVHVDPESLRQARDAAAPPLPGHAPDSPANPLNPPPNADPQQLVDDEAAKGQAAMQAATASAVPAPPIPKKPTVGVKVPDHNPSLAKSLSLRLRIAKDVMLERPQDTANTEHTIEGKNVKVRKPIQVHSVTPPQPQQLEDRMADSKAYGRNMMERTQQFEDAATMDPKRFAAVSLRKEELGSKRADLPDSKFADPEHRKFPINDASHARNAMARANQSTHMSQSILDRIKSAAKKFGVESSIDSVKDLKKAVDPWSNPPPGLKGQQLADWLAANPRPKGGKYNGPTGRIDLGSGITYKADKAPERHTGRPDKPDGPPTKEKETTPRAKWRPVPYTDKHGIRRTGAVNEQGTMLYGQDAIHALSLMSRQGKSPEPGSAGETSDVPTQADRVAGLEERLAQLEGSKPSTETGEAEDPVLSPEDLTKSYTKSDNGAHNLIYSDAKPEPVQSVPAPAAPKSSLENEIETVRSLLRHLHRARRRTQPVK